MLDQAYANIGLSGKKLEIYNDLIREIYLEIKKPKITIFLECSSKESLRRIKNRNREVESQISIDFLEALHMSIAKIVKNQNIIKIDSQKYDFASDKQDQKLIISTINKVIK